MIICFMVLEVLVLLLSHVARGMQIQQQVAGSSSQVDGGMQRLAYGGIHMLLCGVQQVHWIRPLLPAEGVMAGFSRL
jgi:hypothetical protein